MNIEEFREYCLSLPGSREATPFVRFSRAGQSVLVFYMGDKMFCYFDMDLFEACTVKCDPGRIEELRECYGAIGDPYNGNPRYWISVRFNDDVPDDQVKALVKNSYDLVAKGLSKKSRSDII